MKMKKARGLRGFTLIELLVVISIIGLLASIIIASLTSARDKGRVGAGLQFASHNYHAFGDRVFAMYTFNDGSPKFIDVSGTNKNGYDCSSAVDIDTNSPTASGGALHVAGGDQCGVSTNAEGIDTYPLDTSDGLTMSVWVKRASDTNGSSRIWLSESNSDIVNLAFNGTGMDFSSNAVSNHTIGPMGDDKWYNVTISFSPSGNVSAYLDGKLQWTDSYSPSSMSTEVEDMGASGNDFFIDDYVVYNTSLDSLAKIAGGSGNGSGSGSPTSISVGVTLTRDGNGDVIVHYNVSPVADHCTLQTTDDTTNTSEALFDGYGYDNVTSGSDSNPGYELASGHNYTVTMSCSNDSPSISGSGSGSIHIP